METKRIVFLDYLRAISIFMVLVAHVCEFYYGAILNPDPANEADRWWAIIVDSACRASVPLFVITSAYSSSGRSCILYCPWLGETSAGSGPKS